VELTPSEVHGTIVGAMSNHMKSGITPDLLTLIEPTADANDGRFTQLSAMLYELYRENSELLIETKDGFDLILPSDDEAIDVVKVGSQLIFEFIYSESSNNETE